MEISRVCTAYLDESGDLGFGHGSSRYSVIAILGMPDTGELKRMVRRIKRKHGFARLEEIKAYSSSGELRSEVCRGLAGLDVEIHGTVLNKANVVERLRRDTNILYNYTAGIALEAVFKKYGRLTVVADRRTVKVSGGMAFASYLQYKALYEMGLDLQLDVELLDSHTALGLQATDFVNYALFRAYESEDWCCWNLLSPRVVEVKNLFF